MFEILDKAKHQGYSAEIFYVKRTEFSINEEKQIYSRFLNEEGYGLRVFKDGKVGFAYSTRLDENLLDNAIKSWKVSERDDANQIPTPNKVNYLNLYKKFDLSEVVKEKIRELEDLKEKKINIVTLNSTAWVSEVGIISTEGMNLSEKRSGISVSASANYKDSTYVGPEIYETRSFRDPSTSIDEMKDSIIEKVQITSERTTLDFKPKSVILTPKAVYYLVFPLLSHAISLENYYRNRSPLKEGELINEKLRIVDNPLIENSVYSRSFDGEGQQSLNNEIINANVKKFLSNYYWSIKAKRENTASASRGYSSIPYIYPSNLEFYVKNEEEDLSEEGKVYVDEVQGVHTSNFDTGEFSVVGSVSWIIKDGKKISLKEIVVTSNLKDLLKGIQRTSKKRLMIGNVSTGELEIQGLSVV
jgi:Predicted Zn-dependent proteases and their inactivated homologs